MSKNFYHRKYKFNLDVTASKVGFFIAVLINLIFCSSCKKETITSSQPAEKIEISVSKEKAFLLFLAFIKH